MKQYPELKKRMRRHFLVNLFTSALFVVSAVEIVAEYFNDTVLIYITKPLIIPSLVMLYWSTSKKRDFMYIIALLLSMIASIFFVTQHFNSILIGAIFFFFHKILIIEIVLKHIKLPSVFPMVVGCIPFFFAYIYVINLSYERIDNGLLIFIVQCVIISLIGGLAVGNYILRSNRANTLFLISTLLSAITQFIFVWRLYYDWKFFQPLAMLLFVFAQYLFFKFLLLAEKKKAGYQIIQ